MLSVQIMGHMTFVYLRFSRTFVLQTINIYKLVPINTHLAYNFKNYGRDSGQPQKKLVAAWHMLIKFGSARRSGLAQPTQNGTHVDHMFETKCH